MSVPSSSPSQLSLGLVQMSCDENRQKNMDKAIAMIRKAVDGGAQVVCLPELFQDLYPAQTRDQGNVQRVHDLAETIPGPTTEILSDVARKCRIVLVGGSIVERGENGNFYNTAPLFSETGELLGKHRKLHIPQYPLYYEQDYFTPGNLGVQVFQTHVGKIAMGICFDQWFPEMGQLAALQNADLMLFPTAIGHKPPMELPDGGTFDTEHWPEMWVNAHIAQAVPNMMAVGGVNRVGNEGDLRFFGNSCIIDHAGRKVVEPLSGQERVIIREINLQQQRVERELWVRHAHVRPDLQAEIARLTAQAQENGGKR